ncbi:MAG: electron transfer flavoprotein subunit alpha/FixB family protein [Ilumatobacter sp.]|uniref:electron transfer flavoprotein subunit alpha/FixB family protein n=1 Tax=Ilumatobacter sp. TaxID=1967498 RepID=UPI0026130555|nr:electron transfer flavoprotein subunit alpha/FixB family protein [Ilumatobacter sp.]MDJ0768923.1 electron transfer flavoprotein subunit alpha/FixB family protein [Ilumatobacter sp.]
MSGGFLVVIEHDRGTMADASREALTFGRSLATQLGTTCEALLIVDESLADECARYGAETVHVVPVDWLTDYSPEVCGDAIAAAAQELSPAGIVACGTDRGNEMLAHAAAVLDLPFVANCLDVKVADDWEMTRVQWGGSLNEDAALTSPTPIVSIAHHAVEAAEAPVATNVSTLNLELDQSGLRTQITDRDVVEGGVTLATAPVVVGGGRGVGSQEGFAALEELAKELGGVVGCSRAVTNNGWRPHSDQVGQTGTRIAPQLYIACGISGAIQHWVGAKAAKNILAINTDASANMVTKAGYSVIADLHEMLPAITEEVRRRRS